MAEIKVGDRHLVKTDSHQFTLVEIRTNKETGKTSEVVVGYYPKIDQLIKGLFNHGIRSSDAQNWHELWSVVSHLATAVREGFNVDPVRNEPPAPPAAPVPPSPPSLPRM